MEWDQEEIGRWASYLDEAFLEQKEVMRISAQVAELSLSTAYSIQDALIARRRDRGEKIIGMKMGLTSEAKMRQMGVHEPIFGLLTDVMEKTKIVANEYIHPKVEPEIAFLINRELRGNVSREEVITACESVFPALELIDSRYENFNFTLPDVIADNTSAATFVLADTKLPINEVDPYNLGIVLEKNQQVVGMASSNAILGDPVASVIQLVKMLNNQNKSLPASSIVLAGGATAAIPVQSGDILRLKVEKLGEMEISIH